MAATYKKEYIKGGTCPICGTVFGEKWGKNTKNNTQLFSIKIDRPSGKSDIRIRCCREHAPITVEMQQSLMEMHRDYYKEQGTIRDTDTWQLTAD